MIQLTKISETASKITLGWSPVPGAIGYRFQSALQAPKWSHTWDATRSQATFGKAAWYKVEALGLADSGEYPAAAPAPWQGPITINEGGVKSGSWSASGSTPAVTINTDEPVTLSNFRVRNFDGGDLIKGVNWRIPDLTLERGLAYGSTGRLFDAEGCRRISVSNCTIEGTSGMKMAHVEAGCQILVTRNKQRNIQGAPNYLSAFFKVAEVQTATVEVCWNEIINEYDLSHPEDIISLFKSAHCKVHDNYIQHNSTPGNAYNTSSQGTITLDYPDNVGPLVHHNEVYDNQLVDTVNGVLIPAKAHDNFVHHNRVIQDGKLPNGQQMGNGYSCMSILATAGPNNHMHDNVVGFVNRDGQRMDWWPMDGAPEGAAAEIAKNVTLPNPITAAMEAAEWTLWQQKLAANGVTVGA